MAQLPPDGDWLVQNFGTEVQIIHRYTEEVLVSADGSNGDAMAKAQKEIFQCEKLNTEQKAFAHFWFGYFYRSFC